MIEYSPKNIQGTQIITNNAVTWGHIVLVRKSSEIVPPTSLLAIDNPLATSRST